MTKQDTMKILSLLSMTYRRELTGLSEQERETQVGLWQKAFTDVPFEKVSEAVQNYIFTDKTGFAPTIGMINSMVHQSDTPTAEEAWLMVRKACRNGLYGSEKEYNKLPPAVQVAVGGSWQIKVWADFTDAEMEKVGYAFKKSYEKLKETAMRDVKQPEEITDGRVKSLIQGIGT